MSTGSRRALATAYVGTVGVLAATAFPGAGRFGWAEALALLLTLPALLVALPAIYLLGSGAWALTGADEPGAATWPVTLAYTVVLVTVAVANLWLVARLRRARGGAASGLTRA